jgi:MFS family permease
MESNAVIHWRRVITLVGGQGVSLAGTWVLLVALTWTAVHIGGARAVTTLVLAATVPRALTLLLGGAVADLFGPRFVVLRTTAARVVLLLVGAMVTISTQALWPLAVIAAIEGVLFAFAGPAVGTILPRLATGDQLARANSLFALVSRVAPIVGAPVGAWVIAVGELWHAMLIVSVTCSVALLGLLYATQGMPRPPRTAGEGLRRRAGDGVRLLGRNARLRWIFLCAFALDLAFSWPVDVALPLLVKQNGWGVQAVGSVVAAFSAGALLSGILGALMAHRIPMTVRLVVSAVGIAAGIGLMALMPSVLALAVVGVGTGLMMGLNGPAIVTVYQQAAPRSRMGAAMSMLTLAGIGTGPVSIVLFGGVSAVLGIRNTWLLCAVVALVAPVCAVVALRRPAPVEDAQPVPPPVPHPAVPAEAARAKVPPARVREEAVAV